MKTKYGILYVEPTSHTSDEPVIDEYTRKMAAALRQATPGPGYRGYHVCACGARSSNCDYDLPGGEQTNSLCVHYLACHRDELTMEQLDKVAALDVEPVEPTAEELQAPIKASAGDDWAGLGGWYAT